MPVLVALSNSCCQPTFRMFTVANVLKYEMFDSSWVENRHSDPRDGLTSPLCTEAIAYNCLLLFPRLLVGLTVPVECLVCVETSNQSPSSQHIVHELTQLLYNAKEAFLDPRATRAILDHLHRLLEKVFGAFVSNKCMCCFLNDVFDVIATVVIRRQRICKSLAVAHSQHPSRPRTTPQHGWSRR